MQAHLDPKANPEYATWQSTLRHMTHERGMGVLFAGLAPRAFRICGATMILQTVRTKLVGLIESHHDSALSSG